MSRVRPKFRPTDKHARRIAIAVGAKASRHRLLRTTAAEETGNRWQAPDRRRAQAYGELRPRKRRKFREASFRSISPCSGHWARLMELTRFHDKKAWDGMLSDFVNRSCNDWLQLGYSAGGIAPPRARRVVRSVVRSRSTTHAANPEHGGADEACTEHHRIRCDLAPNSGHFKSCRPSLDTPRREHRRGRKVWPTSLNRLSARYWPTR
jgi:hypothetical protein